ncbi:MAG: T9SS C-terminal target domain-containing protein [Ignavibacteriae bacterium]|nr:MAG: T9SS C-terminal target domain-containing protein [Ignavibacteriota bacterium]
MKLLYLIGVLFLFITQSLNAQWVAQYGGVSAGDNPLSSAKGLAVAVEGSSGNCYVAGYTTNPETGNDILVIKYNENGDTLWVRTYSGDGYGDDKAYGIVVGTDGSAYIVGTVSKAGESYQVAVLKYTSDGVLVKDAAIYGETTDPKEDIGLNIAISQSGYIYVTGYSTAADGFSNILVQKYSPTDSLMWTQTYGGPENLDSKAYGIVVDETDNLFITGYTNTAANSNDIITIKYDGEGNLIWSNTHDGSGHGDDRANALAIDAGKNVYVTGYTTSYYYGSDCALLKYNSDGSFAWVRTIDGSADNEDKAYGIVVDEIDNLIIITGYISTVYNSKNYVTASYTPQGYKFWQKTYDGPVDGDDRANAIGLTSDGRIIVTGESMGWNNNHDFATIKYSKYGSVLQISRYSLTGNSDDVAKDIAISDDNDAFITGTSELVVNTLNAPSYATTMTLDWGEENEVSLTKPLSFELSQNYPNPFNPTTNIDFTINQNVRVKINIYDILGRLVQKLVDEDLNKGTYKITFNGNNLSSGTYFYELTAGDFRDVKKMLLIK